VTGVGVINYMNVYCPTCGQQLDVKIELEHATGYTALNGMSAVLVQFKEQRVMHSCPKPLQDKVVQ